MPSNSIFSWQFLFREFFYALALCYAVGAGRTRGQGVDGTLSDLAAPSRDPDTLLRRALSAAQSTKAQAQEALLLALCRTNFLERLDSPEESVQQSADRLRLAQLMSALATNSCAAARQTLVGLIHCAQFTSLEPRQELLVRALASLRPAPPEAIAFWDEQSQPDSINLHAVIEALCSNASEPAITLLEKKLADPNHESAYKTAWMHDQVLRHRNDLVLLHVCQRLLRETLPKDLRPVLVESLCDYRPEWYRSEPPPKPPPRDEAAAEAKMILRQICERALREVKLTPSQKAAVERTLTEINRVLKPSAK